MKQIDHTTKQKGIKLEQEIMGQVSSNVHV